MIDVKYFYYFQGLFKHTGMYKSWVDTARAEGIPMRMVTSTRVKTYINNLEKIDEYSDVEYIRIFPAPFHFRFTSIIMLVYFSFHLLTCDRIVVHVRERSPRILNILKDVFGNDRIKYIIELEGDPVAERAYLNEHPYKEGFYDDHLRYLDTVIEELPKKLANADGILVVTDTLRDVLDESYPDIDVAAKASVIPSGVNMEEVKYSTKERAHLRTQLEIEDKFVLTYVGGAHYSWQNLKRTAEIFALIREELSVDPYLLLLVREKDHAIVEDFLDAADVSETEYLLEEVPHKDISRYLSAADMGVLLRDDHLMNRVVTTAKLGEYLCMGLPVLTTEVVFQSEVLKEQGYGVVLSDMDDDEEVLRKVNNFFENDKVGRKERREWACSDFSTKAHAETYIRLLERLAND